MKTLDFEKMNTGELDALAIELSYQKQAVSEERDKRNAKLFQADAEAKLAKEQKALDKYLPKYIELRTALAEMIATDETVKLSVDLEVKIKGPQVDHESVSDLLYNVSTGDSVNFSFGARLDAGKKLPRDLRIMMSNHLDRVLEGACDQVLIFNPALAKRYAKLERDVVRFSDTLQHNTTLSLADLESALVAEDNKS